MDELASKLVVILFILVLWWFLFVNFSVIRYATYIILLIVFLIVFYLFFIKKYDEYERAVIFRFGRFARVAGPGWSIVIPFIEKEFKKIDVRTHIVNLEIPEAYTADDLRIGLKGSVYYKVKYPQKAVLNIDDYQTGMKDVVSSETRNVISSLTLKDMFGSLDELNDRVADAIRDKVWEWGLEVPMIQIKGITPDDEIIEAMKSKSVAKELLQAQRFKAEAQKVLIEAIGKAAKQLSDRALMYCYIKALESMGSSSSAKLIIPARFFDMFKDIGKSVERELTSKGLNLDDVLKAIQNKLGK